MTEDKFIKLANDCKPAIFNFEIEEIGLQVETYDDCSIKKTVTSLSADEPIEIVDLFFEKSMFCTYSENNFDEEYLSTLTTGIDYCDGELKENIILILALTEE
ncbi:hypothetical protein [Candidatus Venteria ishoeyi]|nr:hypothetical protein [Candidatus Venteria ishoeyi]